MYNEKNIGLALIVFLVSFFCLDILNKFEAANQGFLFYFIKMIKSFFMFYFFLCLLKYKDYKTLKAILLIIVLFASNQLLLHFNSGFKILELTPNIRLFILFLFPIIFSSYVQKLPIKEEFKKKIEYALIFLIILTIATTFMGVVFNINFFKTYPYSDRFGYFGLMPKSITASYFFISALLLTYYKFIILNDKNYKWIFILTLISSVLVGTKAIFLFVPILLGYHILFKKLYMRPRFQIIALIMLAVIFLSYNYIFLFFKSNFAVIYNQYLDKGFLSALTSFRNEIFYENFKIYQQKWEWYNYLIGGKIYEVRIFESSIFDLISFFGFIGSGIYLLYFIKINLNIKPFNNYQLFCICSILIVSFLAGQFFINMSAISYVILTIYLINPPDNAIK